MSTNTLETNMLDAKTQLSRLVKQVETGELDEVVIARNGRPAARIVPLRDRQLVRLGVAKGKFVIPESIDGCNEELLALFESGERTERVP